MAKTQELAKPLNSLERTTLRNAERTIDSHMGSFVQVGNALAVIRYQKLYRETHKTFESYIKSKWDISRDYAYKLIAAKEVAENVDHGIQTPTSERQVRPLTELPPEQQKEAWETAVERAEEAGKPVTAAIVEEVVSEIRGDEKPKPSSEWKCKNCGGTEKDEDGDCTKCREPEEVDDSPEAIMKEVNSIIESFCRKLLAFAEENMPKDKWIKQHGRGDHALQKVKDACSTLRSCKCSALCPKCNGEGCSRCLDTGRVPRQLLEQMT